MEKIREVLRFLFVPSMEGMGMGCLGQMIFWGMLILFFLGILIGSKG